MTRMFSTLALFAVSNAYATFVSSVEHNIFTQSSAQVPSLAPSGSPSKSPSGEPSSRPSSAPSFAPSKAPSGEPSSRPSNAPSLAPSKAPTGEPSVAPTRAPIDAPTVSNPPTIATAAPTLAPTTAAPTVAPTVAPTTAAPMTLAPTAAVVLTDAPTVTCDVDSEFRVNGKTRKDCTWVVKKGVESKRLDKMCAKADVVEACPSACGVCCGDDANFSFKARGGNIQDCEWIVKKFDKRRSECDRLKVKAACMRTCDNCNE